MKTIGLIGGMSWESTISYYQIINETVRERLGGLHSAKILLYSVDFDEIERYQSSGQWEQAGHILGRAAQTLEGSGADFILLCTNTLHKVAAQIAAMIHIPLLHIADATADALQRDGVRRVALLGTKYTMTENFYRQKLADRGFEVLLPDASDMEQIHRIIFQELCLGQICETSRRFFCRVIERLKLQGAEAAILGCTEIGLLLHPEDPSLPLYDTAALHARHAAELALAD